MLERWPWGTKADPAVAPACLHLAFAVPLAPALTSPPAQTLQGKGVAAQRTHPALLPAEVPAAASGGRPLRFPGRRPAPRVRGEAARKGWRNRPVRPPGAAPGLGDRCGESGRPGLLAASGAVRGQEAPWPLPRLYSVERRQSILQGGGITSFPFVSFLNLSLSQFFFILFFF